MKKELTLRWAVAAGTLLAAQGCLPPTKTSPPIETAGAALDRYVSSVETVDQWSDPSAAAARLLMDEYGVPDEVRSDRLIWNGKGPWKRTEVRNVPPPKRTGEDLGIVEQTVGYPLTRPQAAKLAAFDRRLAFAPGKDELTASSDREELNFLRLNLADDVVQGRLGPERARDAYVKAVTLAESGKTSPDLSRLRLTR